MASVRDSVVVVGGVHQLDQDTLIDVQVSVAFYVHVRVCCKIACVSLCVTDNHYVQLWLQLQTCEKYDVATDQWTTVSFCPSPASCQASLLHDDKLYLFGGYSFQDKRSHNTIQVLDTRTWSWSRKVMMNNTAQFFTCAVMTLPKHVLQ